MPRASPRLSLREATLEDLDLLVLHRRRMWQAIDERVTKAQLDAADVVYKRWARQRMRNGQFIGFIAHTRDGQRLASGAVWLKERQPNPYSEAARVPYLLSMYTAPEARGQGVGARIVKAAMKWARDNGHPALELHASRYGRPIYEKLGFEPTPEMRVKFKPVKGEARSSPSPRRAQALPAPRRPSRGASRGRARA